MWKDGDDSAAEEYVYELGWRDGFRAVLQHILHMGTEDLHEWMNQTMVKQNELVADLGKVVEDA